MRQQKLLNVLKFEANLRKIGRNDEKGFDKLTPKINLIVIFDEVVDALC